MTWVLRRACHSVGFEPRVLMRTDDLNMIHGLVAEDLGCTLTTEAAVDSRFAVVAQLLVHADAGDDNAEADLWARYHEDDRLHPRGNKVMTYSPYGLPPHRTDLQTDHPVPAREAS